MWRLLVGFLLFVTVLGTQQAIAQDRFAECDLCGYCQGKPVPDNWPSCQRCLYPNITNIDPATQETTKETLLISLNDDGQGYIPPTPDPGSHHTMIGCLKTDLEDFTSTGAAGNVVQTLLDLLFKVAGGIAFLYLMYGAFLIITSQGNMERLNYGKRVITGAIIGLVFSLSSLLLVNLLASGILKIPGFGAL